MAETVKPRRRVVVTVTIGADSRADAEQALETLARDLPETTSVSGGPRYGWIVEVSEDGAITHESYFAAIETHLAAERERRKEDPAHAR